MSDFFGALSGARFPEVVMNSGPLPPEGGLPAPLHDSADARINYGSTLLGDLSPYAYGEPGYQSSQVSYVNHPHRIQKIFPPLLLPSAALNSQHVVHISHPVDDSDIAFVMRLDRSSTFCTMLGNRSLHRHKMGTAIDPYINLCTLNYLLAGLQLFYVPGMKDSKWAELLHDLDKDRFRNEHHQLTLVDLHYIVRELITPFGIVRGSEKQGGQNEVGYSAATWPVSFAGTLVIDGKERNVVNFWHFHEINAGEDLVFRLKPMPIPFQEGYTLNHYYKNVSRQDISRSVSGGLAELSLTHVWQLVPDTFDLQARPDVASPEVKLRAGMRLSRDYYWQQHGYWHIGRSQVMFRKYGEKEYYNNDMVNSLKLNHLDMTFEPCFLSVPGPLTMGVGVSDPPPPPGMAASGAAAFTGWRPQLGLEFHGGARGLQDAMDVFAAAPPVFGQPAAPPVFGQPGAPPVFGQPAAPPVFGQPAASSARFTHPDDVFIEEDDVLEGPAKKARARESFLSRFLDRDAPPPQAAAAAMQEDPPSALDAPLVISGAVRGETAAQRRRRRPPPIEEDAVPMGGAE